MTGAEQPFLQRVELDAIIKAMGEMLEKLRGEIFYYDIVIFGEFANLTLQDRAEICEHLNEAEVTIKLLDCGSRISIWTPGSSQIQTCFQNLPLLATGIKLIFMKELTILERIYNF